jgi:hypothetical protein
MKRKVFGSRILVAFSLVGVVKLVDTRGYEAMNLSSKLGARTRKTQAQKLLVVVGSTPTSNVIFQEGKM